jgi:hypothetical protein
VGRLCTRIGYAAVLLALGVPSRAAGVGDYSYTGVTSNAVVGGVGATVVVQEAARVPAGHVAAWVGVGGPGLGAGGLDEWIQAGVVVFDRGSTGRVFFEIARGVRVRLGFAQEVGVGARLRFQVLEDLSRPGWWQAWVDGVPVGPPVFLPGSHGAWRAQVMAEDWISSAGGCNSFSFGFGGLNVRASGSSLQEPLTDSTPFTQGGVRSSRSENGFRAWRRC